MGNVRTQGYRELQRIDIQSSDRVRRNTSVRTGGQTSRNRNTSVRAGGRSAGRRAKMARQRKWKRRLLLAEVAVLFVLFGAGMFGGGVLLAKSIFGKSVQVPVEVKKELTPDFLQKKIQGVPEKTFERHPDWEENYLTPNEFSRPGEPIEKVKNIFVHYTANQGTSAAQNRSYFEQLGETGERSASAHFIIGYDGEIVQCIPLDEIGYAVKTRNYDSISIECCYKQENGQFTQETYDSLKELVQWLLEAYRLDPEDVLRHYDCGGKKCPLYYVEHQDAWDMFLRDLKK